MRVRSALAVLATASCVALSGPVLASGDPERGAILADTCLGCHGIPGYNNTYPAYRVPKIGGQNPAYIESALKAYQAGTRQHPTMRAQAIPMTDEDIADLAAFFSQAPRR